MERLWELSKDLPVEVVPLTTLSHLMDLSMWEKEPMGLGQALEHTRRILAADLRYPLILDADGHLMDGAHRLAKAHLEWEDTILVVRFPVTPPPDRPRTDHANL